MPASKLLSGAGHHSQLSETSTSRLLMMRFTSAIVLSTLCWTFQPASASIARVYLHDSPAQPRPHVQSRDLSPTQARLVLAQRAGVEDYHSSDLMKDGTIQAINDFGAQTPLFAGQVDAVKKAFILVESESSSEASMRSLQSFSSFELTSSPDAGASRDLFVDLARQSDPQSFATLSDAAILTSLQERPVDCHNGNTFYIAKSASDAEALVTRLAETQQWSLTTLVLPHAASKPSTSTWGTYTMPNGHAAGLPKRQASPEAPLTDPTYAAAQSSSASSNSLDAPLNAFQDENDGDGGDDNNTPPSTPLRGIFPACFTSQALCESTTRNCMGHGSCALKYRDPNRKNGDCYSCKCVQTKTADGSRTITWAGPACQKKDVSTEFWLITLFTVGLIGLIGFAVGSIWEMGSEPLPSVIGAGVSGTGARK